MGSGVPEEQVYCVHSRNFRMSQLVCGCRRQSLTLLTAELAGRECLHSLCCGTSQASAILAGWEGRFHREIPELHKKDNGYGWVLLAVGLLAELADVDGAT